MMKKKNTIVGLDVGTTKISTIVAEIINKDNVDIIGIGTTPSNGLRKGVVVDIEETVRSIKSSIEEAELMSCVNIDEVYVGIAGDHIRSYNSTGVIGISGKKREITKSEITRVIDAAKAVAIPMDREVLHIIPQEFIVDNQDGIRDPTGMEGVRLEVVVHIVTGAVSSANNIVNSVTKTGITVKDIVLEQLASSEAVLTKDEKDLGVALVDIGGGTTDLAVFSTNSIRHTSVLALGGNHVTSDIAIGLSTPTQKAEELKIHHGNAFSSLISKNELVEIASVGGRPPRMITKQELCNIIEPRMSEILTLVGIELRRYGYMDRIPAGVVLTGGTSMLEGIIELAEDIFGLPVRRGVPVNIGGLSDVVSNPMYSTGVGLVLYGLRNRSKDYLRSSANNGAFFKIMKRMKAWFGEII
ncbi:cell division protein FtsA [bacterium]|nr:cell division protein FtsA [bacterium]